MNGKEKAMQSLPDKYFDPTAPVGEGRRFDHNCSAKRDRCLVVTRTTRGWKWYCHRCKKSGVRSASGLSPRDMGKWLSTAYEKPESTYNKIFLPKDFTNEIPAEGLAWLYMQGIEDEFITMYNFGYSPKLDRVILPVYQGDQLVYWTGRFLGKPDAQHPKYRNVKSSRKDIWFSVQRGMDSVVCVEDILSAIKVGQVIDCFAMLYAHVPDELILDKLQHEYKIIYIWLDPDKVIKVIGLVRRYQAFGIDCRIISSYADPKEYTTEEIKEWIGQN